jgi:hypothetical protein
MDLNEQAPYTLFQEVNGFVVGQTYKMSFDISRNDECGADDTKTGYARIYGNGLDTGIQFSVPAGQAGWSTQSFVFVAFATSHKIYIGSTSSGACGPLLDNVIVDVTTDTAPIAQNLVHNGDFEAGLFTCSGQSFCLSPGAAIAPWVSATANDPIEIDSFIAWQPASGSFSIDLNTEKTTVLYQKVTLEIGSTYTLSFSYSKNGNCDTSDKKGYVNILDDATDLGEHYKEFIGTAEWQVSTFSFQAVHQTVKLAFGSLELGSCGATIDKVSLVLDNAATSLLKRRSRR